MHNVLTESKKVVVLFAVENEINGKEIPKVRKMFALVKKFGEYYLKNFTPKLVERLHKGYNLDKFKRDCVAGLTVAVISIPLAMALAIASASHLRRDRTRRLLPAFLLRCWAAAAIRSAARPVHLLSSSSALCSNTVMTVWP